MASRKVTARANAIGGISKYGKYTRKWARAFVEAGYSPNEATTVSAKYARMLGNKPYEDVQASIDRKLKNKKGTVGISISRTPRGEAGVRDKSVMLSYKKSFK